MTEPKSTATYNEIVNQPRAWEQAIANSEAASGALLALSRSAEWERILVTGCGSTYYLAQAVAALIREFSSVPAISAPGGELWLNPRSTYPVTSRPILVAFSRSGTTTETIAAARRCKEDVGGALVVITNDPGSELATMADICISIPEGQEQSVAQTRSFASMYVAGIGVALALAGRTDQLSGLKALPDICRRVITASEPLIRPLAENLALDRFYFLGSGPRYGLACEANLKLKEMSLTHSEPFHFLEFRHGPMAMVGESTCLLGLLSESSYKEESAVLQEMEARGATVFTLGERGADIGFNSALPEAMRNALYLPPLQLLALYRSAAKGLNPDRPENLTAVIRLEID